MPWQVQVGTVGTEVCDGGWAFHTVVVHVQRQAGKSLLVLPIVVQRCLTGLDRACWYTAQSRNDARDEWLGMTKLVRRSELLKRRLRVVRGAGTEAIDFPTGSAFRIFAPAEDSLHGRSNEIVVVDEAWAFDELTGDGLLQAIVPTFATTGGQLWIISAGGTSESSWLRGWVERGRAAVEAGVNEGIAYFEYGIEDHVDPGDVDAVAARHPAVGYTITRDTIRRAAGSMKPDEFARAYGNRWTRTVERAIPAAVWRSVRVDQSAGWPRPRGQPAVGFDCDPQQQSGAIVAVWRDREGCRRVELLDQREGVRWMPGRLAEIEVRWAPLAVGFDPGGPAASVADAVARDGLAVAPVPAGDYLAACAELHSLLMAGGVAVHAHPGLDIAAAGAVRQNVGDRWKWARRGSGVSIAPLTGATVASWVFDHAPAPFELL